MAADIEGIINQALVDIGYPGRIASINEGSEASIAALEIYGQTRDELFDTGDWPIARRANVVPLTLLKGPPPPGGYNPSQPWTPQYPPPGWLYEYQYPADVITLRAIVPPPGLMFDLLPRPATWRIDNDNSLVDSTGAATVAKTVILTNVAGALAVYTGQVTNPSLWEPGFTAMLVKRLGEKLARRLHSGEAVERTEGAQAAAETPAVLAERG